MATATTTAAAANATTTGQNKESSIVLSVDKVQRMIEACRTGTIGTIKELISEHPLYACQQEETMGVSPLMVASQAGNLELCQFLLTEGAPWNAIDKNGKCAGNYATDAEKWDVVNLLVEWGTRSEMILGTIQRQQRDEQKRQQQTTASALPSADGTVPKQYQPSTKPDYLQNSLRYNLDGTALLDKDNDAVMMEWERPIMNAHASILMREEEATEAVMMGGQTQPRRRVLNVGFGMGIIDTILQEQHNPSLHIIIEAHPDVHKRMIEQKWDQKPNVQVCFGKWQDVIPQLIQQGVEVDAIFFDTYGEHALDMEDFHGLIPNLLSKPQGVYSFFNGLAPDNLFFHGVACQVVKLQLSHLGFDTEFLQCQIDVNKMENDKVWDGIRRQYWHGRDTYYLPRVTWNNEFLGRKTKKIDNTNTNNDTSDDMDVELENSTKRQRR